MYRQPNSRFRTPADLNPRDREHYEVAKSLRGTFSTGEFVARYRQLYPARATTSMIPSDYCFNKENKGNHLYPRFLISQGRSRYSFSGLDGEAMKASSQRAPGTSKSPERCAAEGGIDSPRPTLGRTVNSDATLSRPPELTALWAQIVRHLDQHLPDWRKRIEGFGQVAAVRARQAGKRWSDPEVFEAVLRSTLSAATDWAKVESVLGSLHSLFGAFDLWAFAKTSDTEIDQRFVSWFRAQGAGSQNLARSLKSLVRSARRLCDWSKQRGSAESYFLGAIQAGGGDAKRAAFELGGYNRPHKLPGLGIPLAAEALRNLGFDLAKPDRHVNRALGAFGLVAFRDWKDRSGTNAPVATEEEMLRVMTAAESLADAAHEHVSFTDNAVWLLCAKSGLYLTNEDLAKLALSAHTAA